MKERGERFVEESGLPSYLRRRVVAIAAFTIFVDMVGWGLIAPTIPDLLASFDSRARQDSAAAGGWLMSVYAVSQFIFAPLLSALGDRFGRRPILLTAMVGLTLDYILMAMAPTLSLVILARLVSGIFGSTSAVAYAAVADISRPADRSRLFGKLAAAAGAGFVVGPAIGGMLGSIDIRLPFFFAASLSAAGATCCWALLAETLPPESRRALTLSQVNPIRILVRYSRHKAVSPQLTAFFLFQVALQAVYATWGVLMIERFEWSPSQIGISMTFYGLLAASAQAGLVGPAMAKLGERRVAVIGSLIGAVAFFGFAFETREWMLYAWIAVGALAMMAVPAIQSLLSQAVPSSRQGELQGAIAGYIWIAAIVGPVVVTNLFHIFSQKGNYYIPGAPFILGACLLCAAASSLCIARRGSQDSVKN